MGGAQAIAALALRDRDDRAGRRDRRARQPLRAGGQAPALRARRDRRLRRAERPGRDRRRRRADRRRSALDLLAQAEHGAAASSSRSRPTARARRARGRAATARRGPARRSRVRRRRSSGALEFAEAFAPEHLELIGSGARGARAARHARRLPVRRRRRATAFGDYVAGSNHVLPTGGAARFASALGARALPPADGGGADRPTAAARSPRTGRRSRAPRASRPRGVDAGAHPGQWRSHDPHRRDRPHDRRDRRHV